MNDLIMNAVTTMSSKEIAELTGKRHHHVLHDIRNMLNALGIQPDNFSTDYIDNQGKLRPSFNLPQDIVQLMLDKYKGLARVPLQLQEEASLKTIEQLLGVTLIRQYIVGNYRIDGYDATNNIAYEIDEPAHRYKRDRDSTRQENIIKLLNCKFVRISL